MKDPARDQSQEPVGREPPNAVAEGLATPGRPLDPSDRAFMEARLGHSFADVRVHTDQTAAESARSVGAAAFTVGSDIVFAEGRYEPDTLAGRGLLAHELVHVAQQEGATRPPAGAFRIAPAGDAAEQEADRTAVQVAAPLGAPAYIHAALAGGEAGRRDRAQALDEFRRHHSDDVLEQYRSELAEPGRVELHQSSPLMEVRRAACGRRSEERGESREELARELPGNDEMVREIFAFFYPDLGAPGELNDQLRQLAATMLAAAIAGSRAMDYVPRPPKRPTPGWLFTEVVKIAWRRGRDEGIYEAVRVTVARNFRSEYELAKEGI